MIVRQHLHHWSHRQRQDRRLGARHPQEQVIRKECHRSVVTEMCPEIFVVLLRVGEKGRMKLYSTIKIKINNNIH